MSGCVYVLPRDGVVEAQPLSPLHLNATTQRVKCLFPVTRTARSVRVDLRDSAYLSSSLLELRLCDTTGTAVSSDLLAATPRHLGW